MDGLIKAGFNLKRGLLSGLEPEYWDLVDRFSHEQLRELGEMMQTYGFTSIEAYRDLGELIGRRFNSRIKIPNPDNTHFLNYSSEELTEIAASQVRITYASVKVDLSNLLLIHIKRGE